MIKKEEKEVICELYDIELSRFKRLEDVFTNEEVLKIKKDSHSLSLADQKCIAQEQRRILKIFRSIITKDQERKKRAEQFIANPGLNLETSVENNDESLNKSMFISNEYASYFFSKLTTRDNKNIMVKVSVRVLGENLYDVSDEVIFLDEFVVNSLGEELVYNNNLNSVRMRFCERIWNAYKDEVEYFNHEYGLIDDLEFMKDELKTRYKIEVDFSKLHNNNENVWLMNGYEVFDNRLEENGSIKTIRSQIK